MEEKMTSLNEVRMNYVSYILRSILDVERHCTASEAANNAILSYHQQIRHFLDNPSVFGNIAQPRAGNS